MTIATLLFALIASAPSPQGAGEPILLDFQAAWCGPCRQMRPAIEQLINKGYPVREIDIDRSPDLAERYHVSAVPTFIVTDQAGRTLARTEGLQPAAELARMFLEAKAKQDASAPAETQPEARRLSAENTGDAAERQPETTTDNETDAPAATGPVNPRPWESVVRIKVHARGSIGFGSGTIIYSSPKEAIILTCAHIFKMEGSAQAPPSRFPLKISVDLFDGKLTGLNPAMVHYANETFEGKAIDYDFTRDVGLIRIRPGRKLAYSRVVPRHWTPKTRMGMITVGCSEGHDATAWDTTIVNPGTRPLVGNNSYDAIECMVAPKQGRSGGGLFTSDGYIAGVCDFAEPQGNHGLYAAPRSIYQILDRNNLMALYAPPTNRPPALLASDRSNRGLKPAEPRLRGQSPEPEPDDANLVTIPPPEMLGIKTLVVADANANASPSPRSGGWHRPETTELKLGPAADSDRFASNEPLAAAEAPAPAPAPAPRPRTSSLGWRAVKSPLPELSDSRP